MRTESGELRYNHINGRAAIIAPKRAARPTDLHGAGREHPAPCPFCAGNEHLTPPETEAIRPGGETDAPGWLARAVPNKYPALAGMHEVILHSPEHEVQLEDLGADELAEVLRLWQRRVGALLNAGAAAATLFMNRGAAAGASLAHPHAQLIGTPMVPPLLAQELRSFAHYHEHHGSCILCEELEGAGERRILSGPVAAWMPAAPRLPGELWMAPSEHEADFREANPHELAVALHRTLAALKKITSDAPLNLWIHTIPAATSGVFHWHLELVPRRVSLAGFELASEMALLIVPPEETARALREALPA